MRKIISILIMLLSVPSIWGQNFEYKTRIDELKGYTGEVLSQAKYVKNEKIDIVEAKAVLNKTFNVLDSVMRVYDEFQDDSALKIEADRIISDFIKKYNKAICDSEGNNIQILSGKFLEVAKESYYELGTFYNKVILIRRIEDLTGRIDKLEKCNSDRNNNGQGKADDNSLILSILFWIGYLGCLCLGIFAFVKVYKLERNVVSKQDFDNAKRELTKKLEEVEKRIECIIQSKSDIQRELRSLQHLARKYERENEINISDAGTPPSFYNKPQQWQKIQPHEMPVLQEVHAEELKVDERPAVSYLYATIKAQSSYPEFFKVSTDNSGDKVFMLILANTEANVAKFTIVPNMSPDFMKSVIIDRETYLPSLFCEKSIDSSNPTRIEVISMGSAKKVDGIWQVQDRMIIRLV